MTFPTLSTATHKDIEGHETARNWFSRSIFASCQAVAPPVGFVEMVALPPSSTITHWDTDAQEMPVGAPEKELSSCVVVQAAAFPVGFRDVRTRRW
jgi:hypothetical protein